MPRTSEPVIDVHLTPEHAATALRAAFTESGSLVKPLDVLIPAYDDAAGVTAEFNRNILHVLNRELGADLDVDAFERIALWNAQHEWIDMHLRATRAMRACIL